MNPTDARLATLRAFYQWLSYAGDIAPIKSAITAEIAAIEAEARSGATSTVGAAQMDRIDASASIGTKFGGPSVSVVADPCVPKVDVGCVVRAPSGEAVVVGLNKKYEDATSWHYVYIDGHRKGDRDHDTEVEYLRPATPAERIAAGVDKAPTSPRFRVGQRVMVTKTGANCAAVHEGDVVTVDESNATGITTTTGWMIHNEYLEALPDESPATPPARPSSDEAPKFKVGQKARVVSQKTLVGPQFGAVVTISGKSDWREGWYAKDYSGRAWGFDENELVPADETEGEEARYAEVVRVAQNLVDSYARLRSWDETTCADVHELRKALARSKVKS